MANSLIVDSWQNVLTGLGTARDRTQATRHVADDVLDHETLTSLFNFDDMARKIVTIFPREMMRQGYEIESDDKKTAASIVEVLKELNASPKVEEGAKWGRLYGGSALFVGANDGREAHEPLNMGAIKSVDFLDVHDRRFVYPVRSFANPKNRDFGDPSIYQITHLEGGVSYVHASRLILFRGALTDARTRREQQGWDLSVLQAPYSALALYNETFQSSRVMMSEASQSVFTMKGLIEMIAGGHSSALQTRAMLMDTLRSITRSIFLDADEGERYEKVATSFGGVSDVLVQATNRLAAATEIPVTILTGQSPAGLNATGAADIQIFYDLVRTNQQSELTPRLSRLIDIVARSLGARNFKYEIKYNSLWQETPVEAATRRKTVAEADQIYMQNDVLTPEEVAASRFGVNGWSPETTIDLAARVALARADGRTLPGVGGKRGKARQ